MNLEDPKIDGYLYLINRMNNILPFNIDSIKSIRQKDKMLFIEAKGKHSKSRKLKTYLLSIVEFNIETKN